MATIEQLRAKMAEALRLRDRIRARAAVASKSPALQKQYKDILSRFDTVSSWAQRVTGVYDSAANAFRSLLSGVVIDSRQGVGVAPIIVGASVVTIGAALTAVTAWVSDAYKVAAALDAQARMVEAGADPVAAANATATGARAAHGSSVGDQVEQGAKALAGLAMVAGLVGLAWANRDDIAAFFKKRAKG